jgi:hypothetical protein
MLAALHPGAAPDDPAVRELHNHLRWIIDKGAVPIPGAKNRAQATDNAGALGWQLTESQIADLDRAALGIPELEEVVARYCEKTNRDGIAGMDWYLAYNYFRLAGIIQGIKKRYLDGTASSAHAKTMSERVGPLADTAWEYAVKAGA